MNPVINYIRGTAEVTITGASQTACMNRFAAQKVAFWAIRRISEVEFHCRIYRRDIDTARQIAAAAQSDLQVDKLYGLAQTVYGLKRRPVMVVGMVLVVLALLLLPKFVWTVTVEGNETVQRDEILHTLQDLGVKFGAWGPGIRSQDIKNRILNEIPQLRWCAVNRSGGCLRVLVAEREPEAQVEPEKEITNVVASRAGVILQMDVMDGFKVCEVGDTVTEGQLLVSGYADWTTGIQAVHAMAEIYAMTWRHETVVIPKNVTIKQYTGEEVKRYTLVLGRKRINLSRNSGIPQGKCDKIVERNVAALPGDYSFPATLEVETLRPYELVQQPLTQQQAESVLLHYVTRNVEDHMIAGSILSQTYTMAEKNGCWQLQADNNCREMIAKTVPAPIYESEMNESWQNE